MVRIPDASHLPAMLAAFGVAVTIGATTVQGIVDVDGVDALDGGDGRDLTTNRVTVTVITGSLPGLAPGAAVTVDGEAYVVRDHRPFEDGALTHIDCVKDL